MNKQGKKPEDKKVPQKKWTNSKILKSKDKSRSQRFASAMVNNKSLDILNTEGGGYIETEGMEKSFRLSQEKLKKEVDVNTQSKIFSLTLDQFGPYLVHFDRPGRHLLMTGEKGHIAMMDALQQSLICEFHVQERIFDAAFLHDWDMYATAQNKYLHIYDSQGTEIHCMRQISKPRFLEYLPYHYLLTSCNDTGKLTWLDVSTGEIINQKVSHQGTPMCFFQNPHNAIVFHGSNRGRITMWSPNQNESLVTMLCHRGSVLSGVVDLEGKYMITSGSDKKVKIWDLKTYKPLYEYDVPVPVSKMDLSQTNVLSLAFGTQMQFWKDVFKDKISNPYMTESVAGHVLSNIAFRPFEDQCVVGLNDGIRSLVIPGSGEANIDTYEWNPYETKKQRRERNVQKLLDKIQPDQIVLDPDNMF